MLNHTATTTTTDNNDNNNNNNRSLMSHARDDSLVPPSGMNVTGTTNVSRDVVCFNTSDVDILTAAIFTYQV